VNPSNTVYDAKRLIGRKYGDNTVQHDKKLLPYELLTPTGLPACLPACPRPPA
jgi:molecular chaperone DnaK (HSP70)